MRIKLTFDFNGKLIIPFRFLEDYQTFIYELLQNYSGKDWLHNEGMNNGGRSYKSLVYSHIYGAREIKKYSIMYHAPIHIWIASPYPKLINSIQELIDKRAYFRFFNQTVVVKNYEIEEIEEIKSNTFKTLSPIVVSKPIRLYNGKFNTNYLSAFSNEFSRIAQENLIRKAKSFYDMNLNGYFNIIPKFNSNDYQKCFTYKNTIIKGWVGMFQIIGSKEYLYVAANCGLGSKNAQGFGLIDIINN